MANFKRNVHVVLECQCEHDACKQAIIVYADRSLVFISPNNRSTEYITTQDIQWDENLEPVKVAGYDFEYPDLAETLHSYLKT